MTPTARLRDLFMELMTPSELIRWLGSELRTQAIPAELPGAGSSAVEVAWAAAEALGRRGLVDDVLFTSLEALRPAQVGLIRQTRAALHLADARGGSQAPRPGSRGQLALCELLHRLYTVDQLERVADFAGLSRNIDFRGPPLDVCYRVVRQAERQGPAAIRALEEQISKEYPDDPYFR